MSIGLFEMFILKNENKSNNGPILVLLINFKYIFCMIVQYVDFIQMVVQDAHEMGQDGSKQFSKMQRRSSGMISLSGIGWESSKMELKALMNLLKFW